VFHMLIQGDLVKHLVRGLVVGLALLGGTAGADNPNQSKAPQKVAYVDVNKATQSELEAIDGIGTEYCHHIIMGRPYRNTGELVLKGVIPQETYDKVKDKIIAARQPPMKEKS
jgi:competence protein ComEA